MNTNFGTNKTPVWYLKKEYLEELILETFILLLMVNGNEIHGKDLMS